MRHSTWRRDLPEASDSPMPQKPSHDCQAQAGKLAPSPSTRSSSFGGPRSLKATEKGEKSSSYESNMKKDQEGRDKKIITLRRDDRL
ncbi:hypothetical protein Y1Q_0007806 [Alligator mississippiensis]|uniref:Uncharacterized protein n=1 Tax=Alligator mississippiensis TaxID=8496 RepID=A0A151N761_ALLMI|nr:hypothetical protein Y1Q_0007806 [Alligator mississippiensis]